MSAAVIKYRSRSQRLAFPLLYALIHLADVSGVVQTASSLVTHPRFLSHLRGSAL